MTWSRVRCGSLAFLATSRGLWLHHAQRPSKRAQAEENEPIGDSGGPAAWSEDGQSPALALSSATRWRSRTGA